MQCQVWKKRKISKIESVRVFIKHGMVCYTLQWLGRKSINRPGQTITNPQGLDICKDMRMSSRLYNYGAKATPACRTSYLCRFPHPLYCVWKDIFKQSKNQSGKLKAPALKLVEGNFREAWVVDIIGKCHRVFADLTHQSPEPYPDNVDRHLLMGRFWDPHC